MARFGGLFAVVTALIAGSLAYYGGVLWLINALTAALGSFCAAMASFIAYRSLVLREAAHSDGVLDTIDDKEGLYEEDTPKIGGDQAENATEDNEDARLDRRVERENAADNAAEDNADAAKDEPAADGKPPSPPFKTKAAYAARSFSPIRALGYAPLIGGFFALHSSGAFAPAPFLIALAALPISALIFAALSGTPIAEKDKNQQERR
jgi:hypothetical protein